MAFTSNRVITINYTGDQTVPLRYAAAANASSPFESDVRTFTGAGDNTITAPGGGTTPTAVTIIPPAGNTAAITIKGNAGDIGVRLHNTDPSSIALDPSTTSFILTVTGTVTGIRFQWT